MHAVPFLIPLYFIIFFFSTSITLFGIIGFCSVFVGFLLTKNTKSDMI